MAGSDKTNIHAGHRARLRKRAELAGLSTFNPHEVLEFVLTMVIPRKDVNPLAHELINQFGNLHNVIYASEKDLRQIKGIGPKSVKVFETLKSFEQYLDVFVNQERFAMDTPRAAKEVIAEHLSLHKSGNIWQYNLDINDRFLSADLICDYHDHLWDHMREISMSVSASVPKSVLFGCRVDHLDRHFRQEAFAIQKVQDQLALLGIYLLDYYLFVGNDVYDTRGAVLQSRIRSSQIFESPMLFRELPEKNEK